MVCKYPEGSLCSSFPVLKQLNNWNPLVSDCKDDYFEKILAGKVWYELPVKFKVLVTLESLQQRGSRYMAAIAEQNHLMLSTTYTLVCWLTLFRLQTNCFSWKGWNFHEFWWEAWVLSSIFQSIILVSTVSEYYIKIVWWISPSPDLFPEFVWYFFCKELIDRNVTCLLSLARHGFSVLLHFFLWVSVVQNPRVFLGIFCRVSTFVLLCSSSQLSSPSELGLAGRNGVVFGETGR